LQPLELVTSAPDLGLWLWYATVKYQDLHFSFHLLRVLFPGCLLLCWKQPKTSQYTLHNIDRDIHESRNVTTLFLSLSGLAGPKLWPGPLGQGSHRTHRRSWWHLERVWKLSNDSNVSH
jgi:hypothetical protein